MEFLWQTNWSRLFIPEMSVLEILVRGTITYVALCLLLRVILKRQAGKVSLSDLLVVSIIAGVCRNPLIADAYSITDGMLVVAVVLLWSYALDWLSFYFPFVHQLLHSQPVPLIRDGQVLHPSLEHELMTESQLQSKLRRKGVSEPSDVQEAWMEGDGHVSVITKKAPDVLRDVDTDAVEEDVVADFQLATQRLIRRYKALTKGDAAVQEVARSGEN